jgi:hypothetical protein
MVCGSRFGKQIPPTYVRTIELLLDLHLGDKRNGFVKMTVLATVWTLCEVHNLACSLSTEVHTPHCMQCCVLAVV